LKKIIYIHNNYEPSQVPRKPDSEDRFYTYGFGSNLARNFKRFYPEYAVEMWRLDGYTDKYYEKEVQGVKHRVFPSIVIKPFGEFSLKFVRELKKELKKNKSLLFISHIHTWLTYQVSFFFGKEYPIACSHHGDWSPFFRIKTRKGFRKLKDFIDLQAEKRLLKRIDYFFLCDFFQIPYLEKTSPKINYIIFSSGLDVDKMVPEPKNEARKKIGWEPGKKYILYVGRLYDLKQPKELIDIWKEIKTERPEVELVVIGNSDNDEFNEYAFNSGVMVLGRILNSELNTYYSASDVYVLMALREDYFGGTGIAPLESLACNTPVVSYSMRNYVGDNMQELGEVPGTLELHKKAILKVIDNPDLYKNMRESMKKHYSLEAVASKAQVIFEELMKKYNIN
jgi:glycosyltransferase involved in cell wall biosynthesis